jgi:ABC-type nickel/cobalt efflux system permease component RcnA
MGRIVGATLLVLGVYVIVSLVRHGRDFRLRSRWMLVFAGVRRATRWITRRRPDPGELVVITHEHEHDHSHGHDHRHDHAAVHHHPDPAPAAGSSTGAAGAIATTSTSHRHVHHHLGAMPEDPYPSYGKRTAFAVGILHGVGAETPTQILVFLAATRVGGAAAGVLLLCCFLAGLLVSNTTVAVSAVLGFLSASRNFRLYATVSIVAATFSIVVGTFFVLGQTSVLPALGGG